MLNAYRPSLKSATSEDVSPKGLISDYRNKMKENLAEWKIDALPEDEVHLRLECMFVWTGMMSSWFIAVPSFKLSALHVGWQETNIDWRIN